MALSSLRLRRALALSSYLTKHHTPSSQFSSISCSPPLSSAIIASKNPSLDLIQPRLPFQSRLFRSSSSMLSSSRYRQNNDEEIGPDTILFEGCDYNHWLITMDFPKDPAPTREEMIETYLQTLAKVVGSYDEAKKKMYAFSTTTYQGFQCLVTEEMSEKFRGLPGVVFILPDSYIDPVNKQYGGDQYDNGIITPRPPPLQYGRQGRYNDRNREFNQNRPRQPMRNQQHNPSYGNQRPPMYGDARNFDRQQYSPMYPNYGPSGTAGDSRDNQQHNLPFGNQRPPMYGDAGNFDQLQNSPMQPNYGPAGAGDTKDPMTMNNTPRGTDPMLMQPNYGSVGAGASRDAMPVNNAPRGTTPMPSYQPTYNQNQQGYYNPQGGRVLPEQKDYQRDIRGDNRNYTPPQGPTYGQGSVGHYSPMADANYGQGAGGNYGPGGGDNYNRQGAGGSYGQGAWGSHGQGGGAVQRQEMGAGYGQSQPGNGEEHMFSQVEQRNNMQGEHTTYAPQAQTGQTK